MKFRTLRMQPECKQEAKKLNKLVKKRQIVQHHDISLHIPEHISANRNNSNAQKRNRLLSRPIEFRSPQELTIPHKQFLPNVCDLEWQPPLHSRKIYDRFLCQSILLHSTVRCSEECSEITCYYKTCRHHSLLTTKVKNRR